MFFLILHIFYELMRSYNLLSNIKLCFWDLHLDAEGYVAYFLP